MRLCGERIHIINWFCYATFRDTEIEGRLKVYLFCRFHLAKLFGLHPLSSTALCVAVASAGTGFGLLLYWSGQHHDLQEELRNLPQLPAPQTFTTPALTSEVPQLPNFSSAEFTGQLASVVREIGLSSDEVAYSLETSAGEPYWRYRISLQVQSGYPAIRRFLAAVSSEFPNVVVDAIQCQRENALAAALKCELSLSAFFRKPVKNG